MKPYLPAILVTVGGAIGSLARFGLSGLVQGNRAGFPLGTLVVNLLGCLVMGVLARWLEVRILSPEFRYLLGLGFLGGFTTFSSFSYEALHLFLNHSALNGLLYIGGSLLGTLAAVAAGYFTARMIWW